MIDIDRESEDAKALIAELARSLQKGGYEDVCAAIPDYNQPRPLRFADSDEELIPDVTASINGKKGYFEVSRKSKDQTLLVTKWHLLAHLAKAKDGIFRIAVPRGLMKFTNDLVEREKLDAEIVKM